MANPAFINVTTLPAVVASAIATGQQVTIYDQSGVASRAAIEDLVTAANTLNGCQCVLTATLTIPTADVLTLNTTPVFFGLTVPVGYYVRPIGMDFWATFNSVAYATNTSLTVVANGSTLFFFSTNILGFTADKNVGINISLTAAGTQFIDGADVYVTVDTGDPTAGNSDITLVLTYMLLPTP